MKNKKAKKTYSSTKTQKTSNAKIAVTVLIVFVLLCGAIVGTIAAISDGFTKPVEEWFSDKATVPGDDQGDQTGDNNHDNTPTVCNHIFDHGVCSECGKRAADVLKMATKVVAPDENCVVNFYTKDYKLIESKTLKAGESIEFLKGYNSYVFMMPSVISVPENVSGVEDGSVLIGENFYSLKDYSESEYQYLSMLYPTFAGNKISLIAIPEYVYGYKNGNFISGSSLKELLPGDELILLGGGFNSYVVDGFLYTFFKTNEGISFCSSLDVLNFVVPDYVEVN